MNVKRYVIKIAVMIIMVFAISSVTENSYAYWVSNVTVPSDTSTLGDVGIGNWAIVEPWSSVVTYNIGDQVTHNGTTYEAKKVNTNVEPGVVNGWKGSWTVIG